MEDRRQQREDELGHDIAAGLLDGDRPDRHKDRLVALWHPRSDGLTQPDAVSGQVVGEHEDRHELRDDRHHAAEDAQQTTAVLLRKLPHPLRSELQVGIDLIDVERGIEGLVNPADGLADGGRERVPKLLCLRDEELAQQRRDAQARDHHPEQDDC